MVMLNLFQHLSFQRINLEIPKQVRNDSEKTSCLVMTTSTSKFDNTEVLCYTR